MMRSVEINRLERRETEMLGREPGDMDNGKHGDPRITYSSTLPIEQANLCISTMCGYVCISSHG